MLRTCMLVLAVAACAHSSPPPTTATTATTAGSGAGSSAVAVDATTTPDAPAVTSTGDLPKNVIRDVVRTKRDKISYCYQKQLLAKPTLAGTVKARFVIEADGKVSNSTAAGLDPEVATCIAAAIAELQFPKPDGGKLVVDYPFVFYPESGPGSAAGSAAP